MGSFFVMEKIEKNCLKIIKLSLYLILSLPLIILPFFFYPLATGSSFAFMLLSELIFFTWLFLAIFIPKYRPKKNIISILLGIFVLISIIAGIMGVNPCQSFWSDYTRMRGNLMWIHIFALFLAISSIYKRKDWFNFFFFSATITSLASSVSWLSKIKFFGISEVLPIQSGSFAGNSSFLASYLLFNLFFAILALFLLKDKKEIKFFGIHKAKGLFQMFLYSEIIIMVITLINTSGRAATISFFGGLILLALFWLAFQAKRKKTRILGKIALSLSIIIFLTTVVLLFVSNSFVQQEFSKRGTVSRPIVWREAWPAFLEKPIIGWGPENFIISTNKYFNPSLMLTGEYNFDRAHNIVFDTLVETGILGTIVYFSVFISAIYLLWKKYFNKSLNFWLVAIPTALIVAHFTKNLSVFDTPRSFIMLCLLLAFIVSITSRGQGKNESLKRIDKRFVLLIGLSLFFFFSLTSYFFVQQPGSVNIAIRHIYNTKAPERQISLAAYRKALFGSHISKYDISDYLSMTIIPRIEKKEISIDKVQIIEEAMERNIESSPLDYYNYLFLGHLYNIHGFVFDKRKFKQAERVLEMAIPVSPNNQLAYWKLAKTKAMLGKNKEAVDLAKQALELEPKLMSSHIFLINLYKDLDEQNLADRATKRAKKIFPNIEKDLKENVSIKDL